MTINEIFLKDEISVRAFNTCTDNEIETISELIEYYNTYGSFKHFRNCGKKTDSELISICLKYFDSENVNENTNDLFSNNNIIEFLSEFDERKLTIVDNFIKTEFLNLSVKSSNALNKFLTGDITIKSIKNKIFRDNYFNLNRIDDIGARSIPEVGFFLKEIKSLIIDISKNNTEKDFESHFVKENTNNINYFIEKLNRSQRQIINNYISILTKQLSVRSKNAISNFLGSEPNLYLLSNSIYSKLMFNVNSIKKIGEVSIPEINTYLNEIKNFIIEVYNKSEENELALLELKYLLKSQFNNLDLSLHLQDNNSILKLVNVLIEGNHLFNPTDTIILKKTLKIYNDSVFLKLEKIGKDIGLSGERVRQKRNSIFDKLNSKLQFFQIFEKSFLSKYYIKNDDDFIIITDETSGFINSVDGTNFSKQFLTFIFNLFYKDDYYIVGNVEDVLILSDSKARNRHSWQNIFLVKNDFFHGFDINQLIEDVDFRICERKDETYKFNFKSYLSRFLKIDDYTLLNRVAPICEKIIFEEFNLFLSLDEEIIFERNTIKTIPEYAYEALESLGKPSHVSDINRQLKVLYPEFEKTISNTNLKREFGFVPFGRQSVFGLKKWENESENIKGGTIRDIVEDYLLNFKEPQNIKDIADHVLFYRSDTNEKSIYYNLKAEENNRFLFFKKGFVGLRNQIYKDLKYELLVDNDIISKKTWEENFEDLLVFISKNNRLPSSMNCPEEEIKLNRWLNVQRSKINRGILEEKKNKLLTDLILNSDIIKSKTSIFNNQQYINLREFIINYGRLPSANRDNETKLYAFWYKQRKLYEENSLNIDDEITFNEIVNLIEKI
jgi:hypothetical protein